MSSKESDFKEIQNQYDEWTPTYDRDANRWSYSAPQKIARRLRKYFIPGMEVIDLACGTGLNGLEYRGLGLILVGMDASSQALKKAKEREYQIVHGDILNTGFRDNHFDASLCITALEHFQDIRPYVLEMKRIVKPSGIITFTVACTQIKGLFRTSKKELDQILLDCDLSPLEIFKLLSHKEHGKYPIYFWATIARNSKSKF